MIRTTLTGLALTAFLLLSGCGVGNDIPILMDSEITVTSATDTTITISWAPAFNEPALGKGYQYEVYSSSSPISNANDLDTATRHVTATADELGTEVAEWTIAGLADGSGYFINVAAVNPKSLDLELYDGVFGITTGGTVVTDTYTGAEQFFNHSVAGGSAATAVAYTINLPALPEDIYVVFSNPAATAVARPEVMVGSLNELDLSVWWGSEVPAAQAPTARSTPPAGPVVLRDRPDIADWQAPSLAPASRGIAPPPPPPSYDIAGVSTATFHDDLATTIDATCRSVVTDGATTLNIWVEDSEWSGLPSAPNGKIDQTMVDFLADSFLAAAWDNDIYDWLTNLYGDEWGDHIYSSQLITNNDQITILLWDIGNDGAGGIVGYFWAKDNFLASEISYSNERVMFYLDSASLGTREGPTWNSTDFWPTEMVATLAHEFQHMIHYYQRDILLGATTETWLNEMMSMISEDLVGNKLYLEQFLDIAGPRGVVPSWDSNSGTAGPADNDYGRIPTYNKYPSVSLSGWLSGNDVLKSYSIAYAFGAFLSRNFYGALLARSLMDSDQDDSELVIQEAIEDVGGPAGLTMGDLLWKWGVSVLLSDRLGPLGYVLNNSGWISSSVNTTYDLGSIDHFRYDQEGSSLDGPEIHSPASYPLQEMSGMSNIFYELGLNQTGSLTAVILVPNGVDFTVVVR